MLPHSQPAPGLFTQSELFERSAGPEIFVFPLLRDRAARAEPQREAGCSCDTNAANAPARRLPATPAPARGRGRGRREQDQGRVSRVPRTPRLSTGPALPRSRGFPSHPPPPGNPYLGVQGAQQRVQLHVQAAAADVDGSFQDLAEALRSERPRCSQRRERARTPEEDSRRWGSMSRASTCQPKGRERCRGRLSPARCGGQHKASPPGHGAGAPPGAAPALVLLQGTREMRTSPRLRATAPCVRAGESQAVPGAGSRGGCSPLRPLGGRGRPHDAWAR